MTNKIFKVAEIRDLEKQVTTGEISYSRMVEILNEKALVNSHVKKDTQKPRPFLKWLQLFNTNNQKNINT
jgi:hypothetical protein